jgi:CspA family cold shock protein
MRARGTVKWFNENRGYGFIRNEADSRDVFIDYEDIEGDGWRTLAEGEAVEFLLAPYPGGFRARSVRRLVSGPR